MKTLIWFSAGCPSAVASKLAIAKYGKENCDVVYCSTNSEHPDNNRFIKDVEKWLDHPITIKHNGKYSDVDEVIEKTRYLVGVKGARCSTELKKKIRFEIESKYDVQIFGYTLEEATEKGQDKLTRVERFEKNNPDIRFDWILVDKQLTKQDCLALVDKAGIDIPIMYKLGYRNNNCIGCVKGGQGYWNKIRIDFPEIFMKRSEQERELNVAINKRYEGKKRIKVFLDELDPMAGNYSTEQDISCSVMCELANQQFVNGVAA